MRSGSLRGARRRRLTAVIGHAIAFPTWRSLCAEQGLSNPEAVDTMTTLAASTMSFIGRKRTTSPGAAG